MVQSESLEEFGSKFAHHDSIYYVGSVQSVGMAHGMYHLVFHQIGSLWLGLEENFFFARVS